MPRGLGLDRIAVTGRHLASTDGVRGMASHVYVFAGTGDPVVQRLLPELVNAALERAPGARATNYYDGVATAGCDLVSSGHDGEVHLEVTTEPGIVKSMVGWGQMFEGSAG